MKSVLTKIFFFLLISSAVIQAQRLFKLSVKIGGKDDVLSYLTKSGQITEADVTQLGRAFGTYLLRQGKRRITLGRDIRPSSEKFRDALLEGMLNTGLQVTDLGPPPKREKRLCLPKQKSRLRHLVQHPPNRRRQSRGLKSP